MTKSQEIKKKKKKELVKEYLLAHSHDIALRKVLAERDPILSPQCSHYLKLESNKLLEELFLCVS